MRKAQRRTCSERANRCMVLVFELLTVGHELSQPSVAHSHGQNVDFHSPVTTNWFTCSVDEIVLNFCGYFKAASPNQKGREKDPFEVAGPKID